MTGQLHQQVNIAKLLFVGGLVKSPAAGISAISHGAVYIERWNIGVAESTLPRWVLRGVRITVGDKTMQISDCGYRIKRDADRAIPLRG